MKAKILLIEDEVSAIMIYEKVLRKAGFQVETLMFGQEALAELREIKEGKKEKPDLVLLDLILPDINGMEVLKKAKKEKEVKDIPFVILTNYSDPKIKKMGEKLGAKEYIVKTNITPEEIVMIVKKYLKSV